MGDWGKGMVQLVEIPTDDEIHDNIAAYWLTEQPTRAGDSFNYPLPAALGGGPALLSRSDQLAHVVATRMGRGGQPGKPRPRGVYKFSVEFIGGTLANLPFGVLPEPAIWVSRGTISLVLMEAVPDNVPGHWRLFFDLTVDGQEPVDMRVFLRQGDTLLSETWLYLFEPRHPAEPLAVLTAGQGRSPAAERYCSQLALAATELVGAAVSLRRRTPATPN